MSAFLLREIVAVRRHMYSMRWLYIVFHKKLCLFCFGLDWFGLDSTSYSTSYSTSHSTSSCHQNCDLGGMLILICMDLYTVLTSGVGLDVGFLSLSAIVMGFVCDFSLDCFGDCFGDCFWDRLPNALLFGL